MNRCWVRIYDVLLLDQEITPHAEEAGIRIDYYFLFLKKKNWLFALEKNEPHSEFRKIKIEKHSPISSKH